MKCWALVIAVLGMSAATYAWHVYHTPEAYENRGFTSLGNHQPQKAISEFREASRLKPADPKLHTELGWALFQSGNRPELTWIWQDGKERQVTTNIGYPLTPEVRSAAISEFRTAVALRPADSLYHDDLGIALEQAGLKDQALAEYRTALRLAPDTETSPDTAPWNNYQFLGNLHFSIGMILNERKDYAGAAEELHEGIHYDPERLDMENTLAGLLNQTGHRQEARAAWQDVVTKFSQLDQNEYRHTPYAVDAQAMLTK